VIGVRLDLMKLSSSFLTCLALAPIAQAASLSERLELKHDQFLSCG
jgi:hypothetical protein